MDTTSATIPPTECWPLMAKWYEVTEASTNYANLTPEQNTLRVGEPNRHGNVITRLEFTPSVYGVPEKVLAYWDGPDGIEWSAEHDAGPVR